MGLVALGEAGSGEAHRGIEYLVREQREDGRWRDKHWTGTGFPGVFYLRYHLYSVYFPLMALGYWTERTREPVAVLSRTA
jgi:squalene-hopene/tetraprenyl-beta-curcumene cyclase